MSATRRIGWREDGDTKNRRVTHYWLRRFGRRYSLCGLVDRGFLLSSELPGSTRCQRCKANPHSLEPVTKEKAAEVLRTFIGDAI